MDGELRETCCHPCQADKGTAVMWLQMIVTAVNSVSNSTVVIAKARTS